MEVLVLSSALRHGVSEDAVRHALANAVAFHTADDLTMAIGPDLDGDLLEVGVVESEDGVIVVVHAMPARPKFL